MEEVDQHGAKVFIEPKAMMFVLGSTCAPFRPPAAAREPPAPRG